jgi:DnaJ-class molecular chaperone
MKDPYKILGVTPQAPDSEIKKAYRKLAKQYHPDSAKDDARAQAKFAEVTTAYDLLGDKKKRKAFDNGEIDAEGNPKFQGFGPFGRGQARASGHGGGMGFQGFRPEEIFADLFGSQRGQAAQNSRNVIRPVRGKDTHHKITIGFADAVRGTKRKIRLQSRKSVNVAVKPGIEDGQQIRLKGQGMPGSHGGPPGDALINVHVQPHKIFTRDGSTLKLDLPITLYEAVLGAKIRVPTLEGPIDLKIPPLSSSGRSLRLKGKGVPPDKKGGKTGDMMVTLRIILPEDSSLELDDIMEKWTQSQPYQVRGSDFGNN